MKRTIKRVLFLLLNSALLATASLGQEKPPADEQAVLSWIQQNAIPIDHVEAGKGFSDLQPLKEILKDVKVVGLGESTHGTREFFQIKHRLLEFLVTEMGFNAFALEASYSACQPINEYVLHGKGDLTTILTGQGYAAWDTEEFTEMLKWLRNYNQRLPNTRKVRFYGVDLWVNDIGRKEIIGYLNKVSPERVIVTDSLFRILAREEKKWPMGINAETEKTLLHLLPHLQDLIDHLTVHKDKFIGSSSPAQYDQAMQYARVMKRWIMSNTTALLPPFLDKSYMRSVYMAENLIDLVDREEPEAKFVVWQHNGHISKEGPFQREINFGSHLRRKFGNAYYAFSLEFNQGSFQYRAHLSDNIFGDLKEGTTPPAPAGSFPWYLSGSNMGNLILDLRAPANHQVLKQWFNTPRKVRWVGWAYPEGPQDYLIEVDVTRLYDGIIFIDKTTRTRPTKNAMNRSAGRIGF